MDRYITIDKDGIHTNETENNRLVINGVSYSSADPILLQWERHYDDDPGTDVDDAREYYDPTHITSVVYIRRNSAGAIYLEIQRNETPCYIYTDYIKRDYHLWLPTTPESIYEDLLRDERYFLNSENEDGEERSYLNRRTYVHYLNENGAWVHTSELPSLEQFLTAREDENTPDIGSSKGASPVNSSVIIDLFSENPEAKGIQNWLYYNRGPYIY